jgi:predicted phosphodiesterase
MRTLIIADIHSNIEAFQTVLADAESRGKFERIWCLGDVVGYGPDPVPCIALLRRYLHLCVAGNHDRAVVDWLDIRDFNPHAAMAIRWTALHLSNDEVAYLSQLPEKAESGDFVLVHGSLRQPVDEYVTSDEVASATFRLMRHRLCLVGHSHFSFLCRESVGGPTFEALPEGKPLEMGKERWIVNPGSVGQPRDGDPRAAYVLYDDVAHSLIAWRVEYDIASVQRKMHDAGLPELLADRLSVGH